MTFDELIKQLQAEMKRNPNLGNQQVYLRIKMHPKATIKDQNAELASVTSSGEQPTIGKPLVGEIIIPD